MTKTRDLSLVLMAGLVFGLAFPIQAQSSSDTEDEARAKALVQQNQTQTNGNADTQPASRPVVLIGEFSAVDVSDSTVDALRGLIMSYIAEFDEYRVVDALKQKAVAAKPAITVSGSVIKTDSLYIERLNAADAATGEEKTVADSFASMNELLLSSRRLAALLFGRENRALSPESAEDSSLAGTEAGAKDFQGIPNAAGESAAKGIRSERESQPTLKMIAGSWSGDKGIERISLFPDGKGVALLDSGTIMRLKVSIKGADITIEQDSPNEAAFYRGAGISLSQARLIASKARPWMWIFTLSGDGKSLNGVKQSIFVRISSSGELSVDNDYVREALWKRK